MKGVGTELSLDTMALDVVRHVGSQLLDRPAATLSSWDAGDGVVILVRYLRLRSRPACSARTAERHHLELARAIGATIGGLTEGHLELRGSAFSPYRAWSALAFAVAEAGAG